MIRALVVSVARRFRRMRDPKACNPGQKSNRRLGPQELQPGRTKWSPQIRLFDGRVRASGPRVASMPQRLSLEAAESARAERWWTERDDPGCCEILAPFRVVVDAKRRECGIICNPRLLVRARQPDSPIRSLRPRLVR
jgi:hypothetical protein